MATEKSVKELHKICVDCTSIPIKKLIFNSDWGKVTFEDAQSDLEQAFDIFNYLLILPIELLRDPVIESIIRSAASFQGTINLIKSFDITSDETPNQNRGDIVKAIKVRVDDLCMQSQPYISYLFCQKDGLQRNINELADATRNTVNIASDAEKRITEIGQETVAAKERIANTLENLFPKEDIQAKKEELDSVIVEAKRVLASVGVSSFTSVFSDEEKTLKTFARKWLFVTFIFGVITIALAIILFYSSPELNTGYAAVQLVTTKLIILGVLFSSTVWCGRIYKALMHQSTINRHRANAIETFQAFTKAASNDATRDAVLTETTRSIFGLSPTGYLDKENAGSGSDQLKVIEVIKQTLGAPQSQSNKSSYS